MLDLELADQLMVDGVGDSFSMPSMYDGRLCVAIKKALVQGLLGFPSIELEKCVAGRVTIITGGRRKEKEG